MIDQRNFWDPKGDESPFLGGPVPLSAAFVAAIVIVIDYKYADSTLLLRNGTDSSLVGCR